jgi:hypothetical protein
MALPAMRWGLWPCSRWGKSLGLANALERDSDSPPVLYVSAQSADANPQGTIGAQPVTRRYLSGFQLRANAVAAASDVKDQTGTNEPGPIRGIPGFLLRLAFCFLRSSLRN